MEERKLNLAAAGYHMLQILSAVDGSFSAEEDKVIRKYLIKTYPFPVNLDGEMEIISALKPEDYFNYFNKVMDDFYMDSTKDDRDKFLDFAVKLIKADKTISREENIFIDTLFSKWEPDLIR
ncbi:MAG: TerB family tellurite resistance protein [Bacteroidia bacterium]